MVLMAEGGEFSCEFICAGKGCACRAKSELELYFSKFSLMAMSLRSSAQHANDPMSMGIFS
jgi:hypothetical protein